ncbi:MAG: hypothetical protein KBG48_12400 [Kofleriaceae bacterium]|jgi:hypothetical protein|nr:hypothetical protein [Kofleriaceae bacterium]MBP9168187.1 hypothetical protein [Kofleriaceae bacterium]MBP9856435.1 hypothetical protein [Kofleriaceae bacterium]
MKNASAIFLCFPGRVRPTIASIHAHLIRFGVEAYFDARSAHDRFTDHIVEALAHAQSFVVFLPVDVSNLGSYFVDEISRILVRADSGAPVLVLAEDRAAAAAAPSLYGLTSRQFEPWISTDPAATARLIEQWHRERLTSVGRHYARTIGSCRIVLVSADLFRQATNIAILSSDYFDTDVLTAISPSSLIALLAKEWFAGDRALLDEAIAASLRVRGIVGDENGGSDKPGKSTRYRVGTVAVVRHPAESARRAFLGVGATMRDDTVTIATPEMLWTSLCALWRAVFDYGPADPVSLPIWGSGLGRAGLPQSHLGAMVLHSFAVMAKQLGRSPCPNVQLMIWPPDYDRDTFACLATILDALPS